MAAKEKSGSALIARFRSRKSEYTIVRLPREVGEKLEPGTRYRASVSKAGVITLSPLPQSPIDQSKR